MNWKVTKDKDGFSVVDHIGDEICFLRSEEDAQRIANRHNEYTCIVGFAAVAVVTKHGQIRVEQVYDYFSSFDEKIEIVQKLKDKIGKNGDYVVADSTLFTELHGIRPQEIRKPFLVK